MKGWHKAVSERRKSLTRKRPRKQGSLCWLHPTSAGERGGYCFESYDNGGLQSTFLALTGPFTGQLPGTTIYCSFCISKVSLDAGVSEDSKLDYQANVSLLLIITE